MSYRDKRSNYYGRNNYDSGDDDRGANDEGYHWTWCSCCCGRTEHELRFCLTCGTENDRTNVRPSRR